MCTAVRFSDGRGEAFFGRNLDWSSGYGQGVVVTPRGYRYQSAFLGEMGARAGAVIGMAVKAQGVPLYFDCANEAGLYVAGLNFPGYAKYAAEAVPGKMNVAAYEFPLVIALNFATVEEVKAALEGAAIVGRAFDKQYPVSELHFMIGDRERSIVVEYTERGMEIFENPVDVLTNQPGYAWHRENLRNYLNVAPAGSEEVKWGEAKLSAVGTGATMRGLPGDYYPSSRSVRAAYLNTHYPLKQGEDENVLRLFHTLAGVAMVDGAAAMSDGTFEKTIYTGGYSTATQTYYYSTYENPTIFRVALPTINLEGTELI